MKTYTDPVFMPNERNKKDTQISDYNNNYHKKIKFSV